MPPQLDLVLRGWQREEVLGLRRKELFGEVTRLLCKQFALELMDQEVSIDLGKFSHVDPLKSLFLRHVSSNALDSIRVDFHETVQ